MPVRRTADRALLSISPHRAATTAQTTDASTTIRLDQTRTPGLHSKGQSKWEIHIDDWRGVGVARKPYMGSNSPSTDVPVIGIFTDPAIPEIIEFQRIMPWMPAANTVYDRRKDILEAIASSALSSRINALARSEDSPLLGAQVAKQPLFRNGQAIGLLAVSKDGRWAESLALIEQEVRRATRYGFLASEIEEAKANLEAGLSNATKQAASRSSGEIAAGLIVDSLTNTLPTSPAENLALYRLIESTLSAEAVSEAFRKERGRGPTVIHLSTKEAIKGGERTVIRVLRESAAVGVNPPEDQSEAQFVYADWGAPGQVISDTMISDLGIRTIRFANGLQLNLKSTNLEPGKVTFSLRAGSGFAKFPTDKQGLRIMLPIFFGLDGLEAHSFDELRRILAGKAVTLGLEADESALVLNGETTVRYPTTAVRTLMSLSS